MSSELGSVRGSQSATVARRAPGVGVGALALILSWSGVAAGQSTPWASAQLQLQGSHLSIYRDAQTNDADQTINIGESARVRTCFGATGSACGAIAPGDPSVVGLSVRAELRGPELSEPVPLETLPGGTFVIPGFQVPGDYTLESIRLVDATDRVVASADPPVATLHVRQILLTSATVTTLSLADLQARGITLTQQDFKAFGRVRTETHRSGESLDSIFDQAGNILSSTTGAGVTTTATYDGLGNALRIDRPKGRGATLFGYDRDGHVRNRWSTKSAPTGIDFNKTSYDFDALTGRLQTIHHPDSTFEGFTYNLDDTLDVATGRNHVEVKHHYDEIGRLRGRTPRLPTGLTPPASLELDGGEELSYDILSRLTSARRLGPGSGATQPDALATVSFSGYDSASRPASEIVGQDALARLPLIRSYDVFDRPTGLVLPAGIGHDSGGAFSGFGRAYDVLDRLSGLCADPTLPAGGGAPCASDGGPIGAKWAWGGTSRLYGVTTNGPARTAHRFGYISGKGEQPSTNNGAGLFRLGTLTIGTTSQDPVDKATDPLESAWGRMAYGYRKGDVVKLGRAVESPTGNATGADTNAPSLFSNEGWAWDVDYGLRLKEAQSGKGSLDGVTAATNVAGTVESFHLGYWEGDELKSFWRDVAGESVDFVPGFGGRLARRGGVDFQYDEEGRRTEDDRALYTWTWRGELASVTLKGGTGPFAGQKVRYGYDAVGRLLTRMQLGPLPQGATDDSQRPFIEKREYVWDGDTLLVEVGKSESGALRWRKTFVPGASGPDDAVQVKVESFDATSGTLQATRLYSYLRDEQGTVTGLVEEKAGADPRKPGVLARYLYDPWGQAHVETGPELYAARFDKQAASVTNASGTTQTQAPAEGTAPGAMRLLFSTPIDSSSFGNVVLERRLTDGTWGALTAQELAIGRSAETAEEILVLPIAGWQHDATYRIRLASGVTDTSGRPYAKVTALEIATPASGDILFDPSFPVAYDSAESAAAQLGGQLPGGQPHLFQGLWTDPLSGLSYARARWYDARNGQWLSEDPAGDVDSPSLYAFVGNRPNEFTDPSGLHAGTELADKWDEKLDEWDVEIRRGLGGDVEEPNPFGLPEAPPSVGGPIYDLTPSGGIFDGVKDLTDILRIGESAEAWNKGTKGVDMLAPLGRDAIRAFEIYAIFAGARGGGLGMARTEKKALSTGRRQVFGAARKTARAEVSTARTERRMLGSEVRGARGEVAGIKSEVSTERSLLRREIPCFESFTPETVVATEDGEKTVDRVAPGERVWAFDAKTGERTLRPVLASFLHTGEESLVLDVAGEKVTTTPEHPFFVVGKEWTEAGKLAAGDKLLSLSGEELKVDGVERKPGHFALFNFEVEADHDYFVGEHALLVHNGNPCDLKANRLAGNRARDEIASREGTTRIEEFFRVPKGARFVDVFRQGLEKVGFESKVGRTGLTRRVRRELAKDVQIRKAGGTDRMVWEFWKSKRTKLVGPTKALAEKLKKFGFDVRIHDGPLDPHF